MFKRVQNSRDRTGFKASVGALIAGLIVTPAAAQQSKLDMSQPLFRDVAHELLAGIEAAAIDEIPAHGGYRRPRIRVQPFPAKQGLVSSSESAELDARLMAELMRQGRRKFQFVEADNDPDQLSGVRREQQPADIIIKGRLQPDTYAVGLTFKAVGVGSGLILAATAPRFIRIIKPSVGSTDFAVWSDQAQPSPPPDQTTNVVPLFLGNVGPVAGTRPTVREAQSLLLALGYRPGLVNGVLRTATRRAIRQFEANFNYAVTGRVTRRLVRQLRHHQAAARPVAASVPPVQSGSGSYGD